jgi:hypothetical protein
MLAMLSARCATEEGRWKTTQEQRTVAACVAFLERFPEGDHAVEAIELLHSLLISALDEQVRAGRTAQDIEIYHRPYMQEHPESEYARLARKRIDGLEAWEATRAEPTLEAYQQFLEQHADSEFAPRARAELDRLSLAEAFGSVKGRPRYAKVLLSLEDLTEAKPDVLGRGARLSPEQSQMALEILLEQASIQGSAFSVPEFRPLSAPAELSLDRGAALHVTLSSKRTGGPEYAVESSEVIPRKDGRLSGSLMLARGKWLLADEPWSPTGVRGSLVLEGDGHKTVATTELPGDALLFQLGVGSAEFTLPQAAGSIYRIRGRVDGLVPGHAFVAADGSELCFGVVEQHGLTYLTGKGQVIVPDGSVAMLPASPGTGTIHDTP